MIDGLKLLACFVVALFRSKGRLEAEIVVLRHQLNVLRHGMPSRARLTLIDRLFFVWLYRLHPSVLSSVVIVQPETVVRWHREGLRLYWRARSGRPRIPRELRRPHWRHEPRQSTVGSAAHSRRAPSLSSALRSPSRPWPSRWRAADGRRTRAGRPSAQPRRRHRRGDLLVVPTIGFRLLYMLIILGHRRRRILSFGVTSHPTAEWIARQITDAFPWTLHAT
jgi:hypothetical protein